MEKKFTYSVMSSLKDITLKNVTTILWSHPGILASLEEVGVESKVEDNMRTLEIPVESMEQMKHLIKPIGAEIKIWKKFCEEFLKTGTIEMLSVVKHLSWAHSLGIIDYKKTAENMVRHEMFDIVTLHNLASLFCLVEYIPALWQKIPAEYKNPNNYRRGTHPLFLCRMLLVEGGYDLNPISRIRDRTAIYYEYMFQFSADMGNKVATEYFYNKLPSQIRARLLLKIILDILHPPLPFYCMYNSKFPKGRLSDNLVYLLSLMEPEQQTKILKSKPREILQCLLYWPRHNLFIGIAEFVCNFLEVNDYIFLLHKIAKKCKDGYHFVKIFHQYFLLGSRDFIKEFVHLESERVRVFNVLFEANLLETVKFIFGNLDSRTRKRLIFSRGLFDFFNDLFLKKKLDPFRLCLHESAVSEEEKEELKKAFFGYLNEIVRMPESSKEIIRKLFLECLFGNKVRLPCKRKADD